MGAELMVNRELLSGQSRVPNLVGPEGYVCPIPQGVKPRLGVRCCKEGRLK